MTSTANFHIGTSGWSYRWWRGLFYPESVPQARWLEFFQEHFETVELNATFYRLPAEKVFRRWAERSSESFVFAVKGWRFITHVHRLRDVAEHVQTFLSRARLLGEHMGPVLWQLPPSLHRDTALLRDFLALLPDDLHHSLEFRHGGWFAGDTYDLLSEKGCCALCLYHMAQFETPILATAPFVYIRFHGPEPHYGGSYPDEALETWAGRIRTFLDDGRDVWAYFNNDTSAYATRDARRLIAKVTSAG